MSGFTLVHIFCRNIPASSSKPFQLLIGKQVIFESIESLDNNYCVIDAEIPEPKFTGSAQFYLGVVVKEKGIDELQHFRLEMGNHIEVTVGKAGLVFSQRDNDRFDLPYDSKKVETSKQDEKFDYSKTALDPNLTPKIKKNVVDEVPIRNVFFYIQNIPATYDKPVQLFVDKKLQYTMKTPQAMNKLEVIKVDIPEGTNTIDVRMNIRYDGYDIQQVFDLKKNGEYIQFAIIDDGIRVAQRGNKDFPTLPYQKQRKYDDVDVQGDTTVKTTYGDQTVSNTDYAEVTFYCVGCNASSIKKFIMKVNGNIIHKVEKPIPSGQVVVAKAEFQKPKSGDHKITFSVLCPALGFYEPLEEEFNLTKHGKHIKLEVSQNGDESSANFAIQHEPFKFNGQPVVQVKEEPKKPSFTPVKKDEPKVEVKKPVTTTSSPSSGTKSSDLGQLEQLEALGDLLKRGVLTQDEFNFKKKKILGL